MKKEFITINEKETKKLGEKLADEVLKKKKNNEKAIIISLEGDLGAGKTTFVQGFAKKLKIKEKVLSPTFLIIKKFKLNKIKNFSNLYHIDCYRIKNFKEIIDLDFEKIISKPSNIVIIEWAERIKEILPENIIKLKFFYIDENKRKIIIEK
ncbi:MAG TPA: tRNA (adenosine(37)-N6)-threonylcarbamoyltransferase complex ATPase subunit type 1 TsaE [Candidatus Pacearchaeota archaeon]|jgi:tRNA threonylcarbamoyladenosine biosynthesis protein TsaE|nr:tRNA (adenosine(37)-N6)-threonylcarbamoyltransferase complex ATPase subunit type 1 TsaE [Candidatus Pacearchaeota archaeon]HOL90275.1 tRNA (adenosine(37)-N6)-threonylcarbamoyltransferase complex ATPase subunit type 1 TsaE [Candidatus Pacearchaeota archaeon]HPO68480.1 tRNA (adenosine(37)-N6)-threonylcarbamoyltransferase complex ATPase subunit type 1 TsaE [Candidatus Pacearchaeota archaeon]